MKLIGEIGVTESTKICFFIEPYKGQLYGSIRKFVVSNGYVGPSTNGLNAQKPVWVGIQKLIDSINSDDTTIDVGEVGKVPIRSGYFAMVSINYLKGNYYLQIQKYYLSDGYTGPGKGVAIPLEHLSAVQRYLNKMIDSLDSYSEDLSFDDKKKEIEVCEEIIKGVADEYRNFF